MAALNPQRHRSRPRRPTCSAAPARPRLGTDAIERDEFYLNRSVGRLGPPRPACGERSKFAQRISGEGDLPSIRCLWSGHSPQPSPKKVGEKTVRKQRVEEGSHFLSSVVRAPRWPSPP